MMPVITNQQFEALSTQLANNTNTLDTIMSRLEAIHNQTSSLTSRVTNLELQLTPSREASPVNTEEVPLLTPLVPGTLNLDTLFGLNDMSVPPRGSHLPPPVPTQTTQQAPKQVTFNVNRQSIGFDNLLEQQKKQQSSKSGLVVMTLEVFTHTSTTWSKFDAPHYIDQCHEAGSHYSKRNPEPIVPFRNIYPPAVCEYIVRLLAVLYARNKLPVEYNVAPAIEDLRRLEWPQLQVLLAMALKPVDRERFEAVLEKLLASLSTKLRASKVVDNMDRYDDSAMFHSALLTYLNKIPAIIKSLSFADGSNIPDMQEDKSTRSKGLLTIVKDSLPDGVLLSMLKARNILSKDYFRSLTTGALDKIESIERFIADLIADEEEHFKSEQSHLPSKERRLLIVASLSKNSLTHVLEDSHDLTPVSTASRDYGEVDDTDDVVSAQHLHAFDKMNPEPPSASRVGGSAKYTTESARGKNWEDPPLSKKSLQERREASPAGKLVDHTMPFANANAPMPCFWQVLNPDGCTNSSCKLNHTAEAARSSALNIVAKVCAYSAGKNLPVADPTSYKHGFTGKDMATVKLKSSVSFLSTLEKDGIPPLTDIVDPDSDIE
jgi:hypothetical protein